MATRLKTHSPEAPRPSKAFRDSCIAIVVSEWNAGITNALMKGAREMLIASGVREKNIRLHSVPGAFELPFGAQLCAKRKGTDAVIALGCVIQGETRHFDFICNACANGLMNVGLESGIPVAFGVLTVDNERQAKERAGGKLGNKGAEAAETVLKMLRLRESIKG